MIRKLWEKTRKIFQRTTEAIRNFSSDPIGNLAYLLPVFIGVIAIISGIVTYIMFIYQGGYINQINQIKKISAINDLEDKFTIGTTNLIITGIIGKVLVILILTEFVIMLIQYFRRNGGAKGIVMIVDIIVVLIQIVLIKVIFGVETGQIVLNEKVAYESLKAVADIGINPKTILIAYVVITAISIITFLVLLLVEKECRNIIGHMLVSLAVTYIAVPVFFLFLQNVIFLAVLAVAIIFMVICMYFFVGMIGSGDAAPPSDKTPLAKSNKKISNEVKNASSESINKVAKVRDKKIDLNSSFWRDSGGYGIVHAQNDGIYFKNIAIDKGYACSVSEFEKGTVRIIHKGSRVMDIPGCKRPEK